MELPLKVKDLNYSEWGAVMMHEFSPVPECSEVFVRLPYPIERFLVGVLDRYLSLNGLTSTTRQQLQYPYHGCGISWRERLVAQYCEIPTLSQCYFEAGYLITRMISDQDDIFQSTSHQKVLLCTQSTLFVIGAVSRDGPYLSLTTMTGVVLQINHKVTNPWETLL